MLLLLFCGVTERAVCARARWTAQSLLARARVCLTRARARRAQMDDAQAKDAVEKLKAGLENDLKDSAELRAMLRGDV